MNYEYPLAWPVGVPRTPAPLRSRFDTAEERVKRNLEAQLGLMNAAGTVVTSNVELRRDGRPYAGQRISDNGVAVYFTRKGKEQCVACDKWGSVRDNLHAVALAIEALRGIERWGTGAMVDAAFAGFTALPASASAGSVWSRPWHEVLGVSPTAPAEVIEAAYKSLRRKSHPDMDGGSDAAFNEVQAAFEQAREGSQS